MFIDEHVCMLTLPIPPSINHQYATVRGRRVLSATGRQYKRDVSMIVMASGLELSDVYETFRQNACTQFLVLTLYFYFFTLLRRDLDGGIKIAQDALCEAFHINDNRIVALRASKAQDRDDPRLDCVLAISYC